MTDKIVNTTIEILGKMYPIRSPESEVKGLQQAAQFLNEQMQQVQDSGKAINLERIAIITALNIAHLYLGEHQQKDSLMTRINQRIALLHDKLDAVTEKYTQTEMLYSAE